MQVPVRFRRASAGTGWLAFMLLIGLVVPAAAGPARVPTCKGKKATIIGTNHSETIRGSARSDVIVGLDGADKIYGGGGKDVICGGGGNDAMFGGLGGDVLSGGPGNDRSTGGPNADDEFGDAGADLFLQGSSADGADEILGGPGPDTTTYAARGSALIRERGIDDEAVTVAVDGESSDGANCGDEGDDVGTETVIGTPGPDDLSADPAGSTLDAGDGDDALIGGAGDDTLLGGAGDDAFAGGGGTDTSDALGSESSCDGPLSGCDLSPPEFVSLSVDPVSVDTSAGPKTITVTVRYTDDLSGINFVNGWSQWEPGASIYDPNTHAAGTVLDCTFTFSRVIPRYTAPGVYPIEGGTAMDRVGNESGYIGPQDLADLGIPSSWEQTGAGDTTGPEIDAFTFTPNHVDSSGAARTITVTAHVSDDLSGVRFWEVYFRSESGRQLSENYNHYSLTSGDELDGIYEDGFPVPRFSEQGTWTLYAVDAVDWMGNTTEVLGEELVASGADPSFEQQGAGDVTPPQLEAFSFSPTSVDTAPADQTINVQARVTDDLAGLDEVSATFESPSGQSVQFLAGTNFSCNPAWECGGLESGTILDGVYLHHMRLPRYSEPGVWTLTSLSMADRANNYSGLSGEEMDALGYQTTFHNGP